MKTYKTTGVDLEDLIEDKTIELIAEWYETDNGIGHYECHGYKGFDSQPCNEIDDITWNHELYTADENTIIDNYVNEKFSDLCEKFYPIIDQANQDNEPDPCMDNEYPIYD